MPYKTYDDNPFDDYQGYDEGGSDIEKLMNKLIGQQKKIQSTLVDEDEKTRTQITQTADEIRSEVADADDDLQSQITQNAGEIDIRVREDSVISSINLSPETIQIQSENIDLVGAVTVLSDITGELGTITAGTINGVQINSANIDISENLFVGDVIWLREQGQEPTIYFDNNSPDPPYVSHYADGGLSLKGIAINIENGSLWFRSNNQAKLVNPSNTDVIEYKDYEILNKNDFGTGNSDVARGDHTHNEYASSTHDHDDTYVKQYYSGDAIEIYVNGSDELVVYKAGSLIGKTALT